MTFLIAFACSSLGVVFGNILFNNKGLVYEKNITLTNIIKMIATPLFTTTVVFACTSFIESFINIKNKDSFNTFIFSICVVLGMFGYKLLASVVIRMVEKKLDIKIQDPLDDETATVIKKINQNTSIEEMVGIKVNKTKTKKQIIMERLNK
jgi:hypothetical protein